MNVSSNPFRSLAAQLGRLSVASVSVTRTTVRFAATRRPWIDPNYRLGHGEKIWIFSNIVSGQTVYSHDPVLKATKALRQLAFNGKKLKPSKVRKDHWRPMAMIQFPRGLGHVGRSVYYLMRQFRKEHDLAWGDEMLRDAESNRTLDRHERGERLDALQKANAIADMAVVLSGAGKGNKVRVEENDNEGEVIADPDTVTVGGLLKATVFWIDELDKNYAEKWSPNVEHVSFQTSVAVPIEEAGAVEEAGAEQAKEAGAEQATEAEADQTKDARQIS